MDSENTPPSRRRRVRKWLGLASGLAAAFWYEFRIRARDALNWIVDKAFGDTAFEWLTDGARSMIGPDWYSLLWAHGPTVALSATALYLFLRQDKPTTPSSAPQGMTAGAAPPRIGRTTPAAAPPGPVLPEPEWGKLYELADEGQRVRLRFLPDTQDQEDDTVLLVVLGYKAIKGQDRVFAGAVDYETWRAMREAPNSRIPPFVKSASLIRRLTQQQPEVGQGHVDRGLLKRVGLAQGGSTN